MPRYGSTMMSFNRFTGATRKLVLANLGAFFLLLLIGVASNTTALMLRDFFGLIPPLVLRGEVWQLITYSFLHTGILSTVLELLSIWFLGSFLEERYGARWLLEIYFCSVLGSALAALGIYLAFYQHAFWGAPIVGAFGPIFGMLVAIGVLHGDMEFTFFFLFNIKAKYIAAIYMLLALASLFSDSRFYAFAQLGGALLGFLYIKLAPRRGFAFATSEGYFGLRNRYYRWKRRRAARKFQVYMSNQHNRQVEFDKDGRYIDPDSKKDPNDRRWMN